MRGARNGRGQRQVGRSAKALTLQSEMCRALRRTIGELGGAAVLFAVFVANERFSGGPPLIPLSILRVWGLAAADVTQLTAFAGFLSMFFFLILVRCRP
jgi:hypothetical protein